MKSALDERRSLGFRDRPFNPEPTPDQAEFPHNPLDPRNSTGSFLAHCGSFLCAFCAFLWPFELWNLGLTLYVEIKTRNR
jgi:hypothetical protein